MAAVNPAATGSLLWYYLDYIDPRHLQAILALVMEKLWRGPPPKRELPALQLDEVDEYGRFHQALEAFQLPGNSTEIDSVRKVYKVQMPPNLLSSLEDNMLRKDLGVPVKSSLTIPDIRSICVKDPDFLHSNIFAAHKKSSALYELIHEAYLNDYKEEPLDIQYEPELIEVAERDGTMWLNCSYKGNIVTQGNQKIPFEAACFYNLQDPAISSRSIFIDPRRVIL